MRFPAERPIGVKMRSDQRQVNELRGVSVPLGFHIKPQIAQQKRSGEVSERKFQNLRAINMTKNERAQAAIPHQDTRILSCPARPFLPRGAFNTNSRRDLHHLRRISHGIARAIEGLRGLRLPLVSGPNSRKCLLPRV